MSSKHLTPEASVQELEEGLDEIDIAEELEDPVRDTAQDMVQAGYELILPSSIKVHHPARDSEGSYNVAKDELTASLDPDLFTLESILAHELVHSTQENMEFGPMDQEEYEWNSKQCERFDEIDSKGIVGTYERRLVVGYALTTDAEKELKHEIGRKQNRLKKVQEDIQELEEEIPGLVDDDLIYFQSEEKREQQRKGIERRDELLDRKSELREEMNKTLDEKVEEYKSEVAEDSPVEDYQTLERLEKYSRLSKDETRYHEEIFSYLTSHAFDGERSDQDVTEDLQQEIIGGIKRSEDSNIPGKVLEKTSRAVDSYRESREYGSPMEAAAEVVSDHDLLLRKPTIIVSE